MLHAASSCLLRLLPGLRPPPGQVHTRTQTCVPVGKENNNSNNNNTPLNNKLCVPSQKAPTHAASSRASLYFDQIQNLNMKDEFIWRVGDVVNILEELTSVFPFPWNVSSFPDHQRAASLKTSLTTYHYCRVVFGGYMSIYKQYYRVWIPFITDRLSS